MNHDHQLHPHVYPTGDGERSTAGSNYGDWRPAHPQRPHGYDFEARFRQQPADWTTDPDYRRLRGEHERDLDAHYPHWREARYQRFSEEFGRWREQRAGSEAPSQPDGSGTSGER
ncbi:hypothetical protein J2X16_003136 [Pelomonas aquatica]|uniref:Uncharacterized protein n=1 Tax=Pelomonas aquatica TaxID=431058 RepID=A0ABU1ZAY0_9BURK|nr:hypothetical protein [Pelomonas aquatica]MDR7297787.1 hypothetical protein [Pelomonas aquatica]